MTSRDYTKELGLPSRKKTLPRPVAYVLLAAMAVGVSFAVAGVISETKEQHAAEKAASNPPPAATAPVPIPATEAPPAK